GRRWGACVGCVGVGWGGEGEKGRGVVAEQLAQPRLDRLVGEGNEKKGSDPEAHVFAAHAEADFAGRVAGLASRTAPSCMRPMEQSGLMAIVVGQHVIPY